MQCAGLRSCAGQALRMGRQGPLAFARPAVLARPAHRPAPLLQRPSRPGVARRPASKAATVAAQQQRQGEAGPSVPVRFTVHREVGQGQYLAVVGNHASLGGWKAGQGLHMKWGEGHVWWAEASFPPGTLLEFKCVRLTSNNEGEQEWEECDNHALQIPSSGVSKVDVEVHWGYHVDVSAEPAPVTEEEPQQAQQAQEPQQAQQAQQGQQAGTPSDDQQLREALRIMMQLVEEMADRVEAQEKDSTTQYAEWQSQYTTLQQDLQRERMRATHLEGELAELRGEVRALRSLRGGAGASHAAGDGPSRGRSPTPRSAPAPAPDPAAVAAAAANGFSPEQLAFLERKRSESRSPVPAAAAAPAPARARASSPRPTSRPSTRPAAAPVAAAAPAAAAAANGATANGLSPEQLAFLERKRSESPRPAAAEPPRRATSPRPSFRPSSRPSADQQPSAAAGVPPGLSPEQLAFLERKRNNA